MSFLNKMFNNSNPNEVKSKMDWISLTDVTQLDEIVTQSNEKAALIFKHSTRCSISRFALKQFENEFDLSGKVTPYFLDLLEHRNISNEVAKLFEVTHQSPQIIVIKGGKSVYDTSHDSIQAEKLNHFI